MFVRNRVIGNPRFLEYHAGSYRADPLLSHHSRLLLNLSQRALGGVSGLFGGTHLADVYDQQSESDEHSSIFRYLFPKCCVILAPIGIVSGRV